MSDNISSMNYYSHSCNPMAIVIIISVPQFRYSSGCNERHTSANKVLKKTSCIRNRKLLLFFPSFVAGEFVVRLLFSIDLGSYSTHIRVRM